MKVCVKCKVEKSKGDFYWNRLRNKAASYCKSCTKETVIAWNLANPKKTKEREIRYRKSHRKEIAARTAKWYLKNKSRNNENTARWYKKNKDRGAAKRAKYRLSKTFATPKWSNEFFIREIYHLAQLRTKATGYKWSVDHIVPLKSPLVCGLHVHNNLQVIPSSLNSIKGNRHWPDMPI